MRILFVNDGVGDAGGVQIYLTAVAGALRDRGHELALLHLDRLRAPQDSPLGAASPHFCVAESGTTEAVRNAVGWHPGVVFSHNMRALQAESLLLKQAPVVKMMHAYAGTCISGQKMHAFPRSVACDRRFGAACTLLYLPRHCGQWRPGRLRRQYAWAREQRRLFSRYAEVVVASEHMRREFVRNGVPANRVTVIPLFAPHLPPRATPLPPRFRVLFLGRMTPLKGGDLLIRAAALATAALGSTVPLTLAGDGPARSAWQALSRSLGVDAAFPGWVAGAQRAELFRNASLVAVPSRWPEPFGLTGLEAGAYGAAAVAFDTGGIGTWLRDGENGWLVPAAEGPAGLARALVEARRNEPMLEQRRLKAREAAARLSLDAYVASLERVLADVAMQGAR